jgi:hypothetical protein
VTISLETLLACRPEQYTQRAQAMRQLAERLGTVERSLSGQQLAGSQWRGQAQQRATHQHGRLRESVRTAARMAQAAGEVLSWYGETMQTLQARARALPATAVPAGATPQVVQAAQVAATQQQQILAEASAADGHAAQRLGHLGSGHLTRRLNQVPGMPRLTPPQVTGGRPWQVRPPRVGGWETRPGTIPGGRPTGRIGEVPGMRVPDRPGDPLGTLPGGGGGVLGGGWSGGSGRHTGGWRDRREAPGQGPLGGGILDRGGWQSHPGGGHHGGTQTGGGHHGGPQTGGWQDGHHGGTQTGGWQPGGHPDGDQRGGWQDRSAPWAGGGHPTTDPTTGHPVGTGQHGHSHDWQSHPGSDQPGQTQPGQTQPGQQDQHHGGWRDHGGTAPISAGGLGAVTAPIAGKPTFDDHPGTTPGGDRPSKDWSHGRSHGGSHTGGTTAPVSTGDTSPTVPPTDTAPQTTPPKDWSTDGEPTAPKTAPWHDTGHSHHHTPPIADPAGSTTTGGTDTGGSTGDGSTSPTHSGGSHTGGSIGGSTHTGGSTGGGTHTGGSTGGSTGGGSTGGTHSGGSVGGGTPAGPVPVPHEPSGGSVSLPADPGPVQSHGDLPRPSTPDTQPVTAPFHEAPADSTTSPDTTPTPTMPAAGAGGTVSAGVIGGTVGMTEIGAVGAATAAAAGAATVVSGSGPAGPAAPTGAIGTSAPTAPAPTTTTGPAAAPTTPTTTTAPTANPTAAQGGTQSVAPTKTTAMAADSSRGTPTTIQPATATQPAATAQLSTSDSHQTGTTPNSGHARGDQALVPQVDTPLRRQARSAAALADDETATARYARLNGAEELSAAASPAEQAGRWSRSEDYPGDDRWRTATLPAGTLLAAAGRLLPEGREDAGGGSGFAMPAEVAAEFADDAAGLYESCQVAPQHVDGRWRYPAMLSTYRVVEPLAVAVSIPTANPHWGAGGGTQYYVPDLRALLRTGAVEYVGTATLTGRTARLDADRVRADLHATTPVGAAT